MRILVSGASGLIGSALVARLQADGHAVTALSRRAPHSGKLVIQWDPMAGRGPAAPDLEGFDAVVHLAGRNIATRWSEKRKAEIRISRVRGTQLLAESLAGLSIPPRVLISASAVGYYGDCGGETLSEESPAGKDFLAGVCAEWEAATNPAAEKGIRVVNIRTGVVLSARGGALAKMLPAFKMGMAGRIGSGNQYISWIELDDLTSAVLFCIEQASLRGPVNTVSPEPVTNRELTETLARILRRPAFIPMPAGVVRLIFGEMGKATLLASQRAEPARLIEAGFTFRYPKLEAALQRVLFEPS